MARCKWDALAEKRSERVFKVSLTDFRGSAIIPGVGHWTQQEEPQAFNDALIGFLKEV